MNGELKSEFGYVASHPPRGRAFRRELAEELDRRVHMADDALGYAGTEAPERSVFTVRPKSRELQVYSLGECTRRLASESGP